MEKSILMIFIKVNIFRITYFKSKPSRNCECGSGEGACAGCLKCHDCFQDKPLTRAISEGDISAMIGKRNHFRYGVGKK